MSLRTLIPIVMALPMLTAAPIDFSTRVRPILTPRCSGCHGKQQQMGGVRFDRRPLIRRVSFDLVGLPPERTEDAYETLVDRLLASPHYGEKWARHWLDLARYADSDGYEQDGIRPHAWRYRDWVIRSMNANMPF